MKHRRRNINYTQKRKAKQIVGEWTRKSHKRMVIEEVVKKEVNL